MLVIIAAAIAGTFYMVSSRADQVSPQNTNTTTQPAEKYPDNFVSLNDSNNASTAQAKLKHKFSPNWSGYVVSGSEPLNHVSGYVRVPNVKCTGQESQIFIWVGFDGWNVNTVEQVGISAYCAPGQYRAIYGTWWEMWPHNLSQPLSLAIKPNDKIYMEAKYISGHFEFKLKNVTTKKMIKKSSSCLNSSCQRVEAEWVIERPGFARPSKNNRYYDLANYNKTKIYGTKVGSAEVKPSTPSSFVQNTYTTTLFPVYMVNGNKKILSSVQNPMPANDRFTGKFVRH